MKHQHLSQTKNDIAFNNRESAIARSSTHPIEELQSAIGKPQNRDFKQYNK
jgi:hypothetical protein